MPNLVALLVPLLGLLPAVSPGAAPSGGAAGQGGGNRGDGVADLLRDAKAVPVPGLRGSVYALLVHEGDLVAAGNFLATASDGTKIVNVARWDGSAWHALGDGPYPRNDAGVPMGDELRSLGVFQGNLVVGGRLHSSPGWLYGLYRWDGERWHEFASAENVSAQGVVHDFLEYGDQLLVTEIKIHDGGEGRLSRFGLVAWTGDGRWESVGGGLPLVGSMRNQVHLHPRVLTLHERDLIVAGSGTKWGVQHKEKASGASALLRFDGSSWRPFAEQSLYGDVVAATTFDGRYVVAGWVAVAPEADPQSYPQQHLLPCKVLAWEGNSWREIGRPKGSKFATGIGAFLATDAGLVVGGDFLQIGGVSADCLALWDGTGWRSFGVAPGRVSALAAHDGKLFVGCHTEDGDGLVAIGSSDSDLPVAEARRAPEPRPEVTQTDAPDELASRAVYFAFRPLRLLEKRIEAEDRGPLDFERLALAHLLIGHFESAVAVLDRGREELAPQQFAQLLQGSRKVRSALVTAQAALRARHPDGGAAVTFPAEAVFAEALESAPADDVFLALNLADAYAADHPSSLQALYLVSELNLGLAEAQHGRGGTSSVPPMRVGAARSRGLGALERMRQLDPVAAYPILRRAEHVARWPNPGSATDESLRRIEQRLQLTEEQRAFLFYVRATNLLRMDWEVSAVDAVLSDLEAAVDLDPDNQSYAEALSQVRANRRQIELSKVRGRSGGAGEALYWTLVEAMEELMIVEISEGSGISAEALRPEWTPCSHCGGDGYTGRTALGTRLMCYTCFGRGNVAR